MKVWEKPAKPVKLCEGYKPGVDGFCQNYGGSRKKLENCKMGCTRK